jgi:hypothetical protein
MFPQQRCESRQVKLTAVDVEQIFWTEKRLLETSYYPARPYWKSKDGRLI